MSEKSYLPVDNTSYYRTYDPIENLRVHVSLKHTGSVKDKAAKEDEMSRKLSTFDNKVKNVWKHTFTWQEKKFSPSELLKYKHAAEEKAILFKSHHSITETEYIEDVKNRIQSGEKIIDGIERVTIFSYIDKDGYVPLTEYFTPTEGGNELSALGEAFVNLPKRGDAGKDSKLLKHYTREHSFKTMYIMAAVDVNPEEFQTGKSASSVHSFEQVLGKITIFQGSEILEMKPGFSPFDENDMTGEIKLQKYHFISPGGHVFEYSIENDNKFDEYAERRLKDLEKSKEMHKIQDLNARISNSFVGIPSQLTETRLRAFIEIVSAQNFGVEQLYIQYELVLQGSWAFASLLNEQEREMSSHGCTQTSRIKMMDIKDAPVLKYNNLVDVAHFCFPIELDLVRVASDEVLNEAIWPQIIFTVTSRDKWERHTNIGYGYFTIPSTCGLRNEKIHTWRPQGSIRQQMADWFIGGSRILDDTTYAAVPEESRDKKFLNKYTCNSVSSGDINLRVNTIQMSKAFIESEQSGSGTEAVKTRSLADIMNSVATPSSTRLGKRMGNTTSRSGLSTSRAGDRLKSSGLPPLTPDRRRE